MVTSYAPDPIRPAAFPVGSKLTSDGKTWTVTDSYYALAFDGDWVLHHVILDEVVALRTAEMGWGVLVLDHIDSWHIRQSMMNTRARDHSVDTGFPAMIIPLDRKK